MTDWFFELVPQYGSVILALVTFLSCLALPVPTSLMMLTGGAFVASGDLALTSAVSASLAGAVAGDQVGFQIGRRGQGVLDRIVARGGKRAHLLAKAERFAREKGSIGVFLSRWLISPLGPYVNFVGGATGLRWATFTAFGVAGEAVWVTLYLGLGYAFAGSLDAVADILSNLSGFLAAGCVTLALGWWLRQNLRRGRKAGENHG